MFRLLIRLIFSAIIVCNGISAETSFDSSLITNGHYAVDGQIPYQVRLYLTFPEEIITCGGSLIDHEWVLTAAHCLTNTIKVGTPRQELKEVTVVMGAAHVYSAIVTVVQGISFYPHPDWPGRSFDNDIGLIKIPSVQYSKTLQPIKLPENDEDLVGRIGYGSGYGKTSDDSDRATDHLRWGLMPIIEKENCYGIYGKILDSAICVATPRGTSACSGDSGGPLRIKKNKKLILVGVFSMLDVRGCEIEHPVVYTKVASYMDWIRETTSINF